MRHPPASPATPRADALRSAPSSLRVAWFGHGEGRRSDGLSSYSREIVGALRARGAEVRFFSHQLDGELAPSPDGVRLQALRYKTVTIPLPGSRDRIVAALDAFAPDVVHCSWSFSLQDGRIGRLARQRGAAAVATVHLPYANPRSARGAVMRHLYRYHASRLRQYDRVVALSAGQRELLSLSGLAADRIEVIHNGVDTDAITPGPSALRDRLGASFVVAYLGRLDPEKRVPLLVRSFLSLQWPKDHVLAIAGWGAQGRRLRRDTSAHPNVRMLGVLGDPGERLELLRGADVVVLPSTAEGLSLSLLEAMSAGAAVIATDVGEDGAALADAGLLVPALRPQTALTGALRRLRDDATLRRRLGARARRRVTERYRLEASVDRLLAVYAGATTPPAVAA